MGEQEAKPLDIVAEVKGYKQNQHLHAVNRDGDLFFVECPECHLGAGRKPTLFRVWEECPPLIISHLFHKKLDFFQKL